MKTKTIKSVLKLKIEDWIDSVKDQKVKQAIKEDSIVTGGCIASMLLKEKVNDFDVYFKTRESLITVANYYIKGKNNISVLKGNEDFEPEDESQYARSVRNMEEGQVKLFIEGGGMAKYEVEETENKKFLPVAITPNAISLTDQLQIVVRFWGDPKKIHKNYDYVHATNWYTYQGNHLELRKAALESLLTKELYYIGSKYPITSIIRSKKFINRGFTINAGQMLKMCYQVSMLDLNNIDTLEEQLIGVDIAYFESLIGALRSVKDPSKINYNYISKIIDKIFQ